LFIDGLDEYDGNYHDIIRLFTRMPSNVKACLSSRPLHDFVSAFKSCPSLRLQDLTFGDIKQYVDDELEASEHMRVLQLQNPEEAPKLALEIVNKSDGVFLWVKLVVVQRRIRLLPPSLGDLFSHILGRLEAVYLQQSSRIFQIFAQAQHYEFSLSSLELFFAENQDWKMLTLPVARPLSERDLIIRCDMVDTWLRTKCGGLIEAHHDLESYRRYNARLSYLHRTVLDFLKLPEINSRILAGTAGTAFAPAQALLQSSVLYIKWVMYPGDPKTNDSVWASHPPVYFAEQGLRYTFFAELETKKAQILMLEELDRVCNALLRGSVEPPYCWANERLYGEDSFDIDGDMSTVTQPTLQKFKNHDDSLLTIAIASGLYLYVFEKIQLEPNLVTAKCGRPLLHYAVQQFDTCQISSFCYSEEIIELLLSHGASPNQTYEGKSAWEHVLEAIFELLRKLNTPLFELLVWIRIARLFLLHGANMVQCIENDLNKSAHQIITAAFYDQLPEETRDLQRMLVSTSQIKEMGLQRPTSLPHASSSSSHERESLNIQQSSRKHHCKVIFRIPPANPQRSLQNEIREVRLTKLKEIEMQPLRPANIWVPEPENERIGISEAIRQSPSEQKARMQLPKLLTQFPEQKEQPRAEAQQLSLSQIFNLISVD
jgi:hypothetical protein